MTWSVFTEPDYIFGSGVSPISPSTTRYFALLDMVQNGRYPQQNPVVETGDFEFSFLFATTSTSIGWIFTGIGSNFVRLQGTGELRLRINNGVTTSTVTTSAQYNDGTLHSGVAKLESGTLSITVDGVTNSVASSIFPTGMTIAEIGGSAGNTFDGYLADVDLGNGNSWTLGEDSTTTTEQAVNGNNLLTRVNVAQADVELFTLNTSTNPEQWENAGQTIIIPVAP